MKLTPKQRQQIAQMAASYRQHNSGNNGGVVVFFFSQQDGIEVTGWSKDIDSPGMWVPGCIGHTEDGQLWKTTGGTVYDGAERWEKIQDAKPLYACSCGCDQAFSALEMKTWQGELWHCDCWDDADMTLITGADWADLKEFEPNGRLWLNRDEIYQLALASGFKLKEQPDGEMDLTPYVYEFAEAVLLKAQEQAA